MKIHLCFLSCFLLLSTVQAQNFVEGIVFNDLNKNGRQDSQEQGIPAVGVSNGQEVVLTDKQGKYKLPAAQDQIIFVIKPRDYSWPLNASHEPQFYYINKPKGSPKSDFPGVSATGKLPKSVNFPLISQIESNTYTSLLFGDSQVYTKQELGYFKKSVIQELLKDSRNAKFGITLGDLVGNDLSLHPFYKEAISALQLPWFQVIGNHDINFDAPTDSLSDETFEKNFGPTTYSFNYGNAHFIVIDDVIYPRTDGKKGYIGGMRQDQLDFIENDLKFVSKDKLVVLSYHIPLHHTSEHFRIADRERLFALLKDYPNLVGFSAHTHFQTHYKYTESEGWYGAKPFFEFNVGTTCGDWYAGAIDSLETPSSTMRDGTPKGYLFLNINDNKYDFDYQVMGKPTTYQIAVLAPKFVPVKQASKYAIYANFFVGDAADKVQYRLNKGAWKPMNYTLEVDPMYVNTLYNWDYGMEKQQGKRPSNPSISTHLWKVMFPKLKAGSYELEIEGTDKFGKTHREVTTFTAF